MAISDGAAAPLSCPERLTIMPFIDIPPDSRFGRLVVKERTKNEGEHEATWLCVCDCGNDLQTVAQETQGVQNDPLFSVGAGEYVVHLVDDQNLRRTDALQACWSFPRQGLAFSIFRSSD